MKKVFGKEIILMLFSALFVFSSVYAQEPKTIKLCEPNKKGGLTVQEALWLRSSAREWSAQEASMETLSNLLCAV